MKQRIGEALVHRGAVSAEQLEAALRSQPTTGERVGSILLQMGVVDEAELSETLAGLMRARQASPKLLTRLERSVPRLLPRKLMLKHRAVPIRRIGRTLHVIVADHRHLTGLSTATGCRIRPWIAPEIRVRRLLERACSVRSHSEGADSGGPSRGAASPPQPDPAPADTPDGVGLERLGERLLALDDPAEAVRAVLDHAARFMPVCVFFRVQEDTARILASHGIGLDPEAIERFAVPAWSGTPLELLTVQGRYRGPVPEADPYRAFFRELGLEVPAEILLLPIRLTDRVFGILMGASTAEAKLACPDDLHARLGRMLALALTLTLLRDKMRHAARGARATDSAGPASMHAGA